MIWLGIIIGIVIGIISTAFVLLPVCEQTLPPNNWVGEEPIASDIVEDISKRLHEENKCTFDE